MSISTACGTTSLTGRLVIVFLILYPVIVGAWQLTSANQALPRFSVIPATLVPLFAGSIGTWLDLAETVRAISLFGGGRAATAAGVAEAFIKTMMGAVVAAVVALTMLLARGAGPSVPATTLARAMASVLGATVLALFAGSLLAAKSIRLAPLPLFLTLAAISAVGGAASLGWFIASRRYAQLQIQTRSRTAAAACALVAAAIAFAAWQAVQFYADIAIGR